MVMLTLSSGTIKALECSPDDVRESALTAEVKPALEPLLLAQGFNPDRVIRVVQLRTGGSC
jgi:hypothetical protein